MEFQQFAICKFAAYRFKLLHIYALCKFCKYSKTQKGHGRSEMTKLVPSLMKFVPGSNLVHITPQTCTTNFNQHQN